MVTRAVPVGNRVAWHLRAGRPPGRRCGRPPGPGHDRQSYATGEPTVKALVVSENQLAAVGLLTLVTRSGATALSATPAEVVGLAPAADIVLVYADSWNPRAQGILADLHTAHARFMGFDAACSRRWPAGSLLLGPERLWPLSRFDLFADLGPYTLARIDGSVS